MDHSHDLPLPKEWRRHPLDAQGKYELQMLPPPLAIAILLFHPRSWPHMWRKAEAKFNEEGERVYGHPFTCEELERAQEELEEQLQALELDPEVIHILVGLAMGKDKTDVERMRSVDALHMKLLNTGMKQWHQRQSKVLGALFPILERDEEDLPVDHARSHQVLYNRSMALYLVCLEVCARKGIRVTHRCPPPLAVHMRRICVVYADIPPPPPPPRPGVRTARSRSTTCGPSRGCSAWTGMRPSTSVECTGPTLGSMPPFPPCCRGTWYLGGGGLVTMAGHMLTQLAYAKHMRRICCPTEPGASAPNAPS